MRFPTGMEFVFLLSSGDKNSFRLVAVATAAG